MVIYVYSYNFSVGLKFLKIKSWGNKNKAQNCLYVNTILAFSKITCVCVYMQNLKEWKEIFMYEWQKLLLSSKHFVLFSKVSANEQVFINKNLIFFVYFEEKRMMRKRQLIEVCYLYQVTTFESLQNEKKYYL